MIRMILCLNCTWALILPIKPDPLGALHIISFVLNSSFYGADGTVC